MLAGIHQQTHTYIPIRVRQEQSRIVVGEYSGNSIFSLALPIHLWMDE